MKGTSANSTMPPPSRLPEPSLQEKRYVNALGERQQGETSSPDKAKIKPVFPWEDKPRSTPGHVLLPAVQPASPSPSPPLRYSPTQPNTSPSGFPPSFSDSKAWNSVPSIQKYASPLLRPSQYTPPPSSAFDLSESRRRESARFRNWLGSGEGGEDEEDTGDQGGQNQISKRRPLSGLSSGKSKKEYLSQGKETLDQGV
jgi:glycogenin